MIRQEMFRLLSKVEVQSTGCWNWIASKQSKGYGQIGINGKLVYIHRFFYELFKGKIPKDLTIDHLCRNRACVNPEHLEAVTNKENVMRGFGTGAINARKTHCIHAHPLSGENLYVMPNGGRGCRTCKNLEQNNRRFNNNSKQQAKILLEMEIVKK